MLLWLPARERTSSLVECFASADGVAERDADIANCAVLVTCSSSALFAGRARVMAKRSLIARRTRCPGRAVPFAILHAYDHRIRTTAFGDPVGAGVEQLILIDDVVGVAMVGRRCMPICNGRDCASLAGALRSDERSSAAGSAMVIDDGADCNVDDLRACGAGVVDIAGGTNSSGAASDSVAAHATSAAKVRIRRVV